MWFTKINFKYIYQGYKNVLLNHFGLLTPEKRELYNKRKSICKQCEYLYKPTNQCGICGCFIVEKCSADYDLDKNDLSIDGCPCDPPKW